NSTSLYSWKDSHCTVRPHLLTTAKREFPLIARTRLTFCAGGFLFTCCSFLCCERFTHYPLPDSVRHAPRRPFSCLQCNVICWSFFGVTLQTRLFFALVMQHQCHLPALKE